MGPKNKSNQNTEADETVVITDGATGAAVTPRTPSGQMFSRKAAVMLPTFKLTEDKPSFLHFTQPIDVKQQTVRGEDGVDRIKDIHIASVVDLETGEMGQIVVATALGQNLKDYLGGNQQYVGKAFEITKHAAKPGKKWKPYTVFEINVPGQA